MSLADCIRKNFSRGYFGKAMLIDELPEDYPAWTMKGENWVAVAVPLKEKTQFYEQFSSVSIRGEENAYIGGIKHDLLVLASNNMLTRNEFASVCQDFVEPGLNGKKREELITNPAGWWMNWKNLIGNINSEQAVWDVLGELLELERQMQLDTHPKWAGAEYATQDIETEHCSVEVKTTSKRYGYEVQISSIYQLVPSYKPLYLSFIRVEPSNLGSSIDDIVERLVVLGYDRNTLEKALNGKNLQQGRNARKQKYRVLEWKLYTVDEHFPALSEASFKGGCLPPNVVKVRYTIDLSGIEGQNLYV